MNRIITLALLGGILLLNACSKDNNQVPSSYAEFYNVNYSGQTDRLNMLAEMTAEMKNSNSGGTVDGQKLIDMYRNENTPFADASLNTSTKQLANKTYSVGGDAWTNTTFEYMMGYLASISAQAGNTWAPNQAGVATSGSKAYFFDAYGVEYTQLIEKGLMGAVFYYQMAETYTRDGKIGNGVDNETVEPGKGTDMEHHWDEAFGYFGAPIDLTAANFAAYLSSGDARYHAKYAGKGNDVGLNTVDKMMDQFIKGRHGISTKDYTARDEAAAQLRVEWEMVIATTAIHYINSTINNFSDDALRGHALSEAYAFIISLYYNSDRSITDAQLSTIRGYLEFTPPGSPTSVPNFLNVTTADLNTIKDQLSSIYGLDSVKDQL